MNDGTAYGGDALPVRRDLARRIVCADLRRWVEVGEALNDSELVDVMHDALDRLAGRAPASRTAAMTEEERRTVSKRMKEYWRNHRR